VSEVYLSVDELAARYKRPRSVIYGLRYRGEGPPAIRIGRTLRFRLSDIEAWEAEHMERAD
jgi:predicted DNA-binding transcriptional regulator AlpA